MLNDDKLDNEIKKIHDYGYFCPTAYPIMIDPTGLHCWIDIPKCGSSFIQKVLYDHKWIAYHDPVLVKAYKQAPKVKKFCIMRDPVDRWISGFAQCFDTLQNISDLLDNKTFWKVILRNPVFDDHTEPQWRFVQDVDNLSYIYMGNRFTSGNRFYKDLGSYLNSIGYKSDYFLNWNERINPYTNDSNKKKVYLKLHELFQENPNLNSRLEHWLQADYMILQNAKRHKGDLSTN